MSSYALERIKSRYTNLYLIHRSGEALLVDSGPAGSESIIYGEMQKLGLLPSMLKFLLLTHCHFDHAGSAAVLKEALGCRVIVHESEVQRLQEGYAPIPRGTRWKAKWMVAAGKLLRSRFSSFPAVQHDILIRSSMDLSELGFPGRIIHLPGHTPGSLAVLVEDGRLICGDLLFGLKGKRHFPPFAEDAALLWKSWQALHELEDWHTALPSHGFPIPRESFEREFREMQSDFNG